MTRAEFVGQLDYLAGSITSRERIFLTVLRSSARDEFERVAFGHVGINLVDHVRCDKHLLVFR